MSSFINNTSRAGVWIGGAILIISALLVSIDVIARKMFFLGNTGANELSSYAFAISTSWALAYVGLQRANVRVDIVRQLLPLRARIVLDLLALALLAAFMLCVTFYSFDVVMTSWSRAATANTALATPLYIPQGLWFSGLLWASLVFVVMLLRASVAIIRGDIDTVQETAGLRSTEEEAEEEAVAGERIVKGVAP
ncbi:TRAP transporter small permease subunit [Chelativorans sp. Marseille-P2723]|uniref:TRAP transporter small permease subunit n=1 Tax=Chelativorans sp. Marseille-P2723 TaxID=2709133 RepID=UPI001FEFC21D|nr:TRAP transporter small permease subunit [Chelativorans sp. Marseille-P2723]